MKTFAQWVIALTKGYIKATGKKPDKLAKLKINMEAGQKVRDQEKVIEFPSSAITDWRKPRPTTGKKADVVSSGIGEKAEAAKSIAEDKMISDFMASADRTYRNLVNETLVKVQNAGKDERLQIAKEIINKKGMYRHLDEQDATKILKSIDQNIKPVEPLAYGGVAGMLGERTGYESGRRAGSAAARQRKDTDWYTDKIIADNLGRIKSDMYYKYILPEKQSNWMDDITDEDVYGEYDERKGHTGIFKKSFETKDGEIIDLPYRPDKGIDIIGLLELLDNPRGVPKDYSVKKRKSIELKGGGIAGMLGE